MKAKQLIALFLGIVTIASARAQLIPENNPLVKAAALVGERGLPTAAKPAKSPTVFKPSANSGFVKAYVEKAFDSKSERDTVTPVFEQLLANFEKTAKDGGFSNDASAAIAFSVSLLNSVAKGAELDEDAFPVLITQFQAYFDTAEIRNASDKQKQEASEWALCTVGSVVVYAGSATTQEDVEKLKLLAAASLKLLLGTDIDQIILKGKDSKIVGKGPKKTEPSGAGSLAKGFSFDIPQGWVKDANSSWYVSRYRDPQHGANADTVSALIRFLPAVPAQGSFSDAIRKAWKEGVPTELADKASNMIFRRYIGDGLFCQFIFGKGVEKDRKYQSLFSVYLIDCGSTWQPVVVAQVWDPAGGSSPGGDMSAGFSFGTSADMAEVFMKTFKCSSAKGKPIIDRSALLGEYHYGSSANMQWENIYTGATSMTFISYGGTLNLKPDGSFTYSFSSANGAVGATKFSSAKGSGKWVIDQDILITTYTAYDQGDAYKRKEERYRIAGVIQFADGVKISVLTTDLKKPINACTVAVSSDYFTTKKKD